MTAPWHLFAAVPLAQPAAAISEQLRGAIDVLAASATADAFGSLAPLWRSRGLPTSGAARPASLARATDDDELGVAEVGWDADEDATGWPATAGRLLVVPHPAGGCRVAFLARRSPDAELATRRLDRLHRRRFAQVAVQRFLLELAARLGTGPAGDAAGATEFDRRPLFVHARRPLAADPDEVAGRLVTDAEELVADATRTAVDLAHDELTAGAFRAPPAPGVEWLPASPGGPGLLRFAWRVDEEATGWPRLELVVVVDARARSGAQLVLLSPREAGYDLSRNRVDKAARDRVLRRAGTDVADVIASRLEAAVGIGSPDVDRPLARAAG